MGAEGRIDITVEHRGKRATPLLTATDWFDEGRRAARFLVPPLAPGAVARSAYRIPTRRRGRYQVGPLVVRASDPFGFTRRSLGEVAETDVLVRPRVHDVVAPVAVGSRVTGDTEAVAARAMVSDLGDEFLTLREYELGDDLRRVHWRSTARTGELMIRQDEARWRSQAAIVLDVHPDGHDSESFEVAVEATASVVARLVRLQRRVEVITSAGSILGTGGDPRHDVIDRLATVGTDPTDRLATVLENLRAHRRVDLVVAVLGRVGRDVTRAVGGLAGIDAIVVLTQPVALTRTPSLVVVDASATPFPDAWNRAFAGPRRQPRTDPSWSLAHASSRRSRSTALSAAAALSLSRVFATDRFVVPVLVAVVLAHAGGAVARWRGFPLWATVLLQVGVLLAFVLLVRGPEFDLLGITIGGSDQSLATQLERGWDLLRTAPPPAPATDGALLLAVVASYTVAAVGDWLAFRREAVLAATAPALVLFVWAATLGTDDHRTSTVLGFAAAAACFLLVQNVAVLDRGRSWLVSQEADRRHWLAPGVLLLAVAVLAGVLVAPVLPGAGSDPVLDFADSGNDRSGGGSYRTGIAPLVDVSHKLDEVDDRELFTVDAPTADYWRVAALDRFSSENGGQWTLQASGDEVEIGLPRTAPPGSFHQEYVIGRLGERWIPAAYRPVAIDVADPLVVKSSSTLVADADSVEGMRYSVDSEQPVSAASVTGPMIAATAARVPASLRAFTEVPGDLPPDIANVATAIVQEAGATTPYARAEALRDYFRSGDFTYDLTVDPNDTPDAIRELPPDEAGVLRAVRHGVRGDGAHPRHPCSHRGGVHAR